MNKKIWSAIIFFSISQVLGGCGKNYRINIPTEVKSSESILCGEHSNFVGSEQKDILTKISIRLYFDQKLQTRLVLINARQILADGGEGPLITLGEQLKEGDKFSFQNRTWEILKIGDDGADINGIEVCQRGFVHIKQLSNKT
jgi:hypothetical protein